MGPLPHPRGPVEETATVTNNLIGTNIAFVATGSNYVGNSFSTAAGGGFNFVMTNTALTDAGNNTGP